MGVGRAGRDRGPGSGGGSGRLQSLRTMSGRQQLGAGSPPTAPAPSAAGAAAPFGGHPPPRSRATSRVGSHRPSGDECTQTIKSPV